MEFYEYPPGLIRRQLLKQTAELTMQVKILKEQESTVKAQVKIHHTVCHQITFPFDLPKQDI